MKPADAAHFEALFRQSDDPWHYDTRWYERRKHALAVAALPHERYADAFEPGCANGPLTALLAPRCDRLLAMDASAAAVEITRKRLQASAHVEVRQGDVLRDWPQQRFDLVVVSELGYYLDEAALDALASRIREALRPGGVLLACHWRQRAPDFATDAPTVHAALGTVTGEAPALRHVEPDFLLEAWVVPGAPA